MHHESLTQMQLLGVGSGTNVAEGHPRYALTPGQRAVVDRFPEFLETALREPFPVLDARAHAAFFGAVGQKSAPVGTGRIVSLYSSSVAIDVVGRCLAEIGSTVAVIHPTLDCIPALLRSRGVSLLPVSERRLRAADPLADLAAPVDAVFVATPNNPTGTHLNAEALASLADSCARRRVILVIDSCFRAFDPRAQYDAYAVLDRSGVEYVVIEDTGKLWPLAGVKLGFVVFGAGGRLRIPAACSDILLTASPFVALVVEALSQDLSNGGMRSLHDLIAANRHVLEEELGDCEGAKPADRGSRVSVSRLRMGKGRSSTRVWGRLLRDGVHSVPCRPFYWARPSEGERFLRIALARDGEVVRRAAWAIRRAVGPAD
jgi:histidinol-phosphate/aromatic aminotransferase/cobyric acid decarboxylase-like protein